MIRVRVGGTAATIIGGLWAVLALADSTGHNEQLRGFTTGFAVAAAGAAITALATWWERR